MHPARVPVLAPPRRKNRLEIRFGRRGFIEPIMKESIFCSNPLQVKQTLCFIQLYAEKTNKKLVNDNIYLFGVIS